VEETTLEGWLAELASSAPAPGGGAAGALEAAIGAALVEMSASLTIGKPAYAEHEPDLVAARDRAQGLRAEALELVDEDAKAFSEVMSAYRLPRESEQEKLERGRQVQAALAAAADVPRRTASNAQATLELAERIAPFTNVNVVSDVAVAAASARAALVAALVNVEANRNGIEDAAVRDELAAVIAGIETQLGRADAVVATVRALGAG